MKYELTVLISFRDKYTNKDYKVGEVITVEESRGNELLADKRKLVSLKMQILPTPEEPKKPKRTIKAKE